MQTKVQAETAKIFKSLFTGLQRGYGILDSNGNHRYVKGQPTLQHYMDHLEGKISLGIVPITDKGNCRFGAMDLDDHHNKPVGYKFNYKGLLEKIKFLKLPLTVFESKSGGAHCYLFLDQYYTADNVRHILKKFSYALGYPRDVEVFPKQVKLKPTDNGNFINLPYKGGNSRVLIDFEGNQLKAEEAMVYATKRLTNGENLKKFKLVDHGKTTNRNDRTFAATAFFKKHYEDWEDRTIEYNKIFNVPPLEDKELFSTVLKSNEKKDYSDAEIVEAPPAELVGYDYSDYRIRTDITKPVMLVDDLLIEGSMNFEFGQKGVGKSEFILGLANAIARGLDFLQFGISRAHPVVYLDAEMHPYDTIARNEPYYKNYSKPPAKNYFHVLNWNDQKDRHFPDIQHEVGQNLIQKYLEKVESLTGKKPIFILDNLRSASGYEENNSDSWRPIGLWLKKLSHGLNYTLIVVDHSGKSVELEMRGTSAKADHANLCLQILSEKRKGGLMRIKVKYAKARGLRPDQTADFVAQYDFTGNWTIAASDKELIDEELKKELKVLMQKKWSQHGMAKELDISAGKVNKLIKEIEKEKI